MKQAIFALCSRNNLGASVTAINALAEKNTDFDSFVLYIGEVSEIQQIQCQLENVKILFPDNLPLQGRSWQELAFKYPDFIFFELMKYFVFGYLFLHHYTISYFVSPTTNINFQLLSEQLARYSNQAKFLISENLLNTDKRHVHINLDCLEEGDELMSFKLFQIPPNSSNQNWIETKLANMEFNFNQENIYSIETYADKEKILLSDRIKYLNLHPLERKNIGNPFESKDKIRRIKALIGRKDLVEELAALSCPRNPPNISLLQYTFKQNLKLFIKLGFYITQKIIVKLVSKVVPRSKSFAE